MDLRRDQPIALYDQLKTLPTGHDLCERSGLSRTPVIHALTDLAVEGGVLHRRRQGTFVNPHWLSGRAAGDRR